MYDCLPGKLQSSRIMWLMLSVVPQRRARVLVLGYGLVCNRKPARVIISGIMVQTLDHCGMFFQEDIRGKHSKLFYHHAVVAAQMKPDSDEA